MQPLKTPLGDVIYRYPKALVLSFQDRRNLIGSSPLNGGYREDLTAVFNFDEKLGPGKPCQLRAGTYEDHLRLIAAELGLNPERVTGISTAASMKNAAVSVKADQQVSVTAIVTGGVEINGARAGDPAAYDELSKKAQLRPGTINIILEINAALSAATLVRAVMTCTEAKTAALQELMAGSNYSQGIATGSGTDGCIVIGNPEAEITLTDAGKHSRLGELIGLAVIAGVKEALRRETGLAPESQHSMLRRFRRFGLDEEFLWREYQKSVSKPQVDVKIARNEFLRYIGGLDRRDQIVVLSSLYIHLLDQYQWGLLQRVEVVEAAGVILDDLKRELGDKSSKTFLETGKNGFLQELVVSFASILVANFRGKV